MSNIKNNTLTFTKVGTIHRIVLALLLCSIVPDQVDAQASTPTVPPPTSTLAIMGDSQYDWGCASEAGIQKTPVSAYCSVPANAKKSKSQQATETNNLVISRVNEMSAMLGNSFKGLVINGDLTAYGSKDGNLNKFKQYYMNQKDFWVWPALGNHDYGANVIGDHRCGTKGLSNYNHCAASMMQFLAGFLDDNKNNGKFINYDLVRYAKNPAQTGDERNVTGSLAYSWEIGDFHFVQFNYYPTYTVSFVQGFGSGVGSWKLNATSPQQWLQNDLAGAVLANKTIVLNWHDFYIYWVSQNIDTNNDYRNLITWLDPYVNNIKAIFVAHEHIKIGQVASLTFPATSSHPQIQVPVIYSGAPIWNRFIKADFASDGTTCSITTGVVNAMQTFTGQTTDSQVISFPCPTPQPAMATPAPAPTAYQPGVTEIMHGTADGLLLRTAGAAGVVRDPIR